MICRSWYLETWDSGWRTIDYAVAVVMTLIVIGLVLHVGSYVVDAVKKAKPAERVLAVFCGTYMDFFRKLDTSETTGGGKGNELNFSAKE